MLNSVGKTKGVNLEIDLLTGGMWDSERKGNRTFRICLQFCKQQSSFTNQVRTCHHSLSSWCVVEKATAAAMPQLTSPIFHLQEDMRRRFVHSWLNTQKIPELHSYDTRTCGTGRTEGSDSPLLPSDLGEQHISSRVFPTSVPNMFSFEFCRHSALRLVGDSE